jgi:Protein of unknown function (DUF1569)
VAPFIQGAAPASKRARLVSLSRGKDITLMTSPIQAAKVTGRRQLRFHSLEDILADVEKLAGARSVRALGAWSHGQVLQHLAIIMTQSIDGYHATAPWLVRFIGRNFLRRRYLTKPMPAGFKLPRQAADLLPPPTSPEDGLHSIRQALGRLSTETKRMPNPIFGPLSVEEWTQLHCRHSELHLSFLITEER